MELSGWTRLAHRVRRFLSRQQDLGLWSDANGRPVCGYVLWREQQTSAAPAAMLRTLREEPERLRSATYEGKTIEQMAAEDWRQAFDTMFRYLSGPAALDDVLAVLAIVFGIPPPAPGSRDDTAYGHAAGAPLRARLAWFWRMLVGFGHEWRAALLLNMPGELRSVASLGGVTEAEVGQLLALSVEEYDRARELLHEDIGIVLTDTPDTAVTRLAALQPYLPLHDDVVAGVLQVQPFQVLNLRLMVLAKLKSLWDAEQAKRSAMPPLPGEHL
jgi:hypothetical protein